MIDFENVIPIFDAILSRGLCRGSGFPHSQMCLEQAICVSLGLPFSDKPRCVTTAIREFKIKLNDCSWSSSEARAKGLRNLGIAQIGSKGVINDCSFTRLMHHKFITILIPTLFREIFIGYSDCLAAALECEKSGSLIAIENAHICAKEKNYNIGTDIFFFVHQATSHLLYEKVYGIYKLKHCVDLAQQASKFKDKYLLLAAEITLDVLKELKSPGCDWI